LFPYFCSRDRSFLPFLNWINLVYNMYTYIYNVCMGYTVQLNLNLTVARVCTNVARYISNDTRDLLSSACGYFLQYVPCKDNIACQLLSSAANCMPSTLEHSHSSQTMNCICWSALEYSQILVLPSSIQESFFLNTRCLVKVSSCMLVIKKCIA